MTESVPNPQESWEERANRVAAQVITQAKTHDEFFDLMEAQEVTFPAGKNMNNFVRRFAFPAGKTIGNTLNFAEMVGAPGINFAKATTDEIHAHFESILGDTKKQEAMLAKTKHMTEKDIHAALDEIRMRLEARAILPAGVEDIGNNALMTRYQENDPVVKEFFFKLFKKELERGTPFHELWK